MDIIGNIQTDEYQVVEIMAIIEDVDKSKYNELYREVWMLLPCDLLYHDCKTKLSIRIQTSHPCFKGFNSRYTTELFNNKLREFLIYGKITIIERRIPLEVVSYELTKT